MALFLYLCQAQMLRFVYIIFHSTSLNESFVNMIIVTHKICLVGVAHSWASGETVPRPYLLGKTVTSLGLLFMSWAMWWDSGMSILAQIEIDLRFLITELSIRKCWNCNFLTGPLLVLEFKVCLFLQTLYDVTSDSIQLFSVP